MIEVLLLAFALAMDAFAVSVGLGVKSRNFDLKLAIKASLMFGVFQGIMPLFGHFANVGIGNFTQAFDHWIAFVLLILIGAKMLYESFGENTENDIANFSNKILLLLAIATSIDAMAAGFTLNLLKLNPFVSMFIIGMVTFLFSLLGVFLGTKGGSFLEDKAEKAGGIVLIFIGIKILIEHTM